MTKITVDKALIEQAIEAAFSPYCAQALGILVPALRAALAKPVVETDDPLHCDLCGDATDDPWHFSTSQDRHKHACDKCWESKKALRAALAEVVEPVAWLYDFTIAGDNKVYANWVTQDPTEVGKEVEGISNVRPLYASPPPPAEVPLLTTDECTTLAHRIASKYTHRSDPQHIAYTFLPHTLEQFVRGIEQAVRQNAGLK